MRISSKNQCLKVMDKVVSSCFFTWAHCLIVLRASHIFISSGHGNKSKKYSWPVRRTSCICHFSITVLDAV